MEDIHEQWQVVKRDEARRLAAAIEVRAPDVEPILLSLRNRGREDSAISASSGILFDIDTAEDIAELISRASGNRIARLLRSQKAHG